MKPPFNYFGGKTSMAERIAALLPPHEHYVEPFAGSLAVLLAKPLSPIETANDIDGRLMTFWRVLRDRPDDLERACALTPHSRAEHQASFDLAGCDELEVARRVWVRVTQGRSSRMNLTGWRHHYQSRGGNTVPADMDAFTARITAVAARLRRVSLECLPALELIQAYGPRPGVLLFADPPYLRDCRPRSAGGYDHEMFTEDDHRELAMALGGAAAAVVLCGYASTLYEQIYAGWHRTEVGAFTGNAVRDRSRTEVLWSNRPFPAIQAGLFDAEEATA